MKRSLTRNERIRKKSEFDDVFKFGIKSDYNGIKILVKKNRLSINRLGIIVKKGLNSSVKRNREKRLVKEAFRFLKPKIIQGNDLIFIVIKTGSSFYDRIHQLETLFRRFNLFMELNE
jgi:ribonuclease P protein component